MSVQAAMAYLDQYAAAVVRETAALGRPVVCGKGCFHCCKEMVWAERREALFLVEHIAPDALPEVTEKTRLWWKGFFDGGFQHMPSPEETKGALVLMNYRRADLWCPMLKDGICTGYKQRPGSCRVHLASKSRALCADDYKRRRQEFAISDVRDQVLLGALDLLTREEALPVMQFDHLGIWLGHLLLGKSERSDAAIDIQTH